MNKDDSGTTMVESAPHYRIGVSCSHPSWMIQLLEYAIPATSATATDCHKNPDLHREVILSCQVITRENA